MNSQTQQIKNAEDLKNWMNKGLPRLKRWNDRHEALITEKGRPPLARKPKHKSTSQSQPSRPALRTSQSPSQATPLSPGSSRSAVQTLERGPASGSNFLDRLAAFERGEKEATGGNSKPSGSFEYLLQNHEGLQSNQTHEQLEMIPALA